MKKIIILVFTTVSLFYCSNSGKDNSTLERENELLKKELELEKREHEISSKEIEIDNQKFKVELNVSDNLIYCQNEKFIIRIDRMKDGDLRYISWNKPKSENELPGLILSNGGVEQQGTIGGYIFTFVNKEWTYIIEDNQVGETDESVGRFLKLLQNGNEILYTKMKDIN
jgi:hypothetical protein